MSDLLVELNPQQKEAVLHTKGPLLILAGAGSGKTRVIAHRVAYLVRAQGVLPHQILAVTFTNKAAAEMKGRVERLLARSVSGLFLSTFHAACLKILRRHIHVLGYKNDFMVLDAADQMAVVKSCLQDLSVNEELYPPRAFLSRISQLKHQLIPPEQYVEGAASFGLEGHLARVYPLYQEKLIASRGLDFDDLIGLSIRLLESSSEVLQRYREQFHYLMVDEYQDTNHAQYRLIRLLLSEERNLCVVGDDDQSIYAFRGADIRNILQFERDFPDVKVVVLNQNYRSTQTILSAASAVIEKNSQRKAKGLWTQNVVGEPVIWAQVEDEEEEAVFVRSKIEEIKRETQCPCSNFSVLYRTNAQSRVIEEVLRNGGMPYFIVGGLRFYERKEIKDLIAYLKLIVNPDDLLSVKRVINLPPRGIGAMTLERLADFSKREGCPLSEALARLDEGDFPASGKRGLAAFNQLIGLLRDRAQRESLPALLRFLIEEIHYLDYLKREFPIEAEGRIENVLEFIAAADQFRPPVTEEPGGEIMTDLDLPEGVKGGDLSAFLDQIALVSSGDEEGEKGDGIALMTLHAAKGLEFPVVFMVGMEEGLFPHARALANHQEMEEERRLCYVGMTRAMDRLYLISAFERRLYGTSRWNTPSRFIRELPKDAVRIEHPSVKKNLKREEEYQTDRPDPSIEHEFVDEAYDVGAFVRHPLFGVGEVRRLEGEGDAAKVTVTFSSVGTKKLAIKYAKLERC